jgi:LysM repeat protein
MRRVTQPYPGKSSSRLGMLVAALLAVALMAGLLAVALATGILQFQPPGGEQALLSPSPEVPPTEGSSPTVSVQPEPTAEPSPQASPTAPASPTAEPSPTARPTPGGIHTVRSGETLSTIGDLYGVRWEDIAAANELEQPFTIHIGQKLQIPLPPESTPGPLTHIVQSGETITSIAELHDVDPTELAEANEIENWDLIFVGQELIIPGTGPEASPSPRP